MLIDRRVEGLTLLLVISMWQMLIDMTAADLTLDTTVSICQVFRDTMEGELAVHQSTCSRRLLRVRQKARID